jgi:CBS domain-containing protein
MATLLMLKSESELLWVDAQTATSVLHGGLSVATVPEKEGMFEALRSMHDKGVRRTPVAAGLGGLVGILTLDDLLSLLALEMTELVKLVSNEQQREAAVRT